MNYYNETTYFMGNVEVGLASRVTFPSIMLCKRTALSHILIACKTIPRPNNAEDFSLYNILY